MMSPTAGTKEGSEKPASSPIIVGGIADEDHGVRLLLLELQYLRGDVGRLGAVGDLQYLEPGLARGLVDAAGDGGAVFRVLVDDGDALDLFAGLFHLAEKIGIGLGEIGSDGRGAEDPFEAAS